MGFYRGPGIVRDGLILYLDAANPKSYPGTGITWKDLSGKGNNGTLVNGPTFNSENRGCIVFDGVNDYVNCGTANIVPLSYSVSCLVKLMRLTGNNFFISKTETINSYSQNFAVGYVGGLGGGFVVGAKLTDGSFFYECVSNFTPTVGEVYNVSATYDHTTFTYNLYINGVLNNTKVASFGNTVFNTQMIQIGATDAVAANLLQGNIYFAKVYNRVLTPEEILQNYNATKSRFGL